MDDSRCTDSTDIKGLHVRPPGIIARSVFKFLKISYTPDFRWADILSITRAPLGIKKTPGWPRHTLSAHGIIRSSVIQPF